MKAPLVYLVKHLTCNHENLVQIREGAPII